MLHPAPRGVCGPGQGCERAVVGIELSQNYCCFADGADETPVPDKVTDWLCVDSPPLYATSRVALSLPIEDGANVTLRAHFPFASICDAHVPFVVVNALAPVPLTVTSNSVSAPAPSFCIDTVLDALFVPLFWAAKTTVFGLMAKEDATVEDVPSNVIKSAAGTTALEFLTKNAT
jgi:hypothetical protein